MKAFLNSTNQRVSFEVEAPTAKAIFEQLAELQEVFDAATKCGVCNSTFIAFSHRVVEKYHYYELKCRMPGCGARFQYGQQREGGNLFPKRRDDDGNALPNHGWSKYVAKMEEPQKGGR